MFFGMWHFRQIRDVTVWDFNKTGCMECLGKTPTRAGLGAKYKEARWRLLKTTQLLPDSNLVCDSISRRCTCSVSTSPVYLFLFFHISKFQRRKTECLTSFNGRILQM